MRPRVRLAYRYGKENDGREIVDMNSRVHFVRGHTVSRRERCLGAANVMVRARLAVDAAPARVPPGLTAQSPAGVCGGAPPSGGSTREYTGRQGHAERSPGGRAWLGGGDLEDGGLGAWPGGGDPEGGPGGARLGGGTRPGVWGRDRDGGECAARI